MQLNKGIHPAWPLPEELSSHRNRQYSHECNESHIQVEVQLPTPNLYRLRTQKNQERDQSERSREGNDSPDNSKHTRNKESRISQYSAKICFMK